MKRVFGFIIALGIILAGPSIAAAEEKSVLMDPRLSHPSLLSQKKQIAYLKVGMTGFKIPRTKERAPVNVAIVVDKSGSMSGAKLAAVKEVSKMVIHLLSSKDIVSVVSYNHYVDILLPATKLTNPESVKNKVDALTASGNTAIFAGVNKGAHEVRKFLSQNNVNRVILLSDGLANVGPKTPYEFGELGKSFINEGISVVAIGLGLDYNEDLMMALARESDGIHRFAEQPSDLGDIFDKDFGYALSAVANNLNLEITLAEGVRPVRLLGRSGHIQGNKVKLKLNQLFSEHEFYALLEIEVPAHFEMGTHKIADTEISYFNIIEKREENIRKSITANFVKSPHQVQNNINKDIMVDAVTQQSVENTLRAVKYRDHGDLVKARQEMERNARMLQDSAQTYNSSKLKKLEQHQREQSEEIQDNSKWKKNRKGLLQHTIIQNLSY